LRPYDRFVRGVRRLALLLVPILLVGGVSTIAAIGSIGASDSCDGCDTTPGWASVGMIAFEVLLGLWVVYAVTLALRRRSRRS
jgi:hypothetical protein